MMFDTDNGNTNWEYYELLKLKHIYNFDSFDSIGPATSDRISPRHTKIQLHLIYEYNQYERYKARMVDPGNMTRPNLDTYYFSVI